MIVRRSFHQIKPGKGNMSKALELLKEGAAFWQRAVRVYTSTAGAKFGTLCIEMEADSLAEFESKAAKFDASTQGKAWYERWGEVTGEGHAEFWTLR